jgi:hypothetical protein
LYAFGPAGQVTQAFKSANWTDQKNLQ